MSTIFCSKKALYLHQIRPLLPPPLLHLALREMWEDDVGGDEPHVVARGDARGDVHDDGQDDPWKR